MITLTAAVLTVMYALQIPLCLYIRVDSAQAKVLGVGFGAIGYAGARRRAESMQPRAQRMPFWGRRLLEESGWMKSAWRGASYLYAHRMMLRVSVDATLGGEDAARLALCWGAADSLLQTLSACTDGRITGTLQADFSSAVSHAQIQVRYAVKAGVLLNAAGRAVRNAVEKKVKTWKSIPLKAS